MPRLQEIPRKILLVDDDERFAEAIRMDLENLGYEVHLEYDVAGARRRLQSDHFHFHIFDLFIHSTNLDEPDGLDLIVELQRQQASEYHNAWFLITSADNWCSAVLTLQRTNPENFCMKNNRNELQQKLDKAFRESTPQNWDLAIDAIFPESDPQRRYFDVCSKTLTTNN